MQKSAQLNAFTLQSMPNQTHFSSFHQNKHLRIEQLIAVCACLMRDSIINLTCQISRKKIFFQTRTAFIHVVSFAAITHQVQNEIIHVTVVQAKVLDHVELKKCYKSSEHESIYTTLNSISIRFKPMNSPQTVAVSSERKDSISNNREFIRLHFDTYLVKKLSHVFQKLQNRCPSSVVFFSRTCSSQVE